MEMSKWWLHNAKDFVAFNADDKLRIEDLTGCIPLLLVPFLGHPGKTLESLEPQIWADASAKQQKTFKLSGTFHAFSPVPQVNRYPQALQVLQVCKF